MPTTPSITSPASGSITNSNNIGVVWSGSNSEFATISNYTLQYSTDISFGNNISSVTNGTSLSVSLGNQGVWYFRVRSSDTAGNYSTWSSTVGITLSTSVPTTPVISVPVSGYTTNNGNIGLIWSASSSGLGSIVNYTLQYSTDSGFASSVSSVRVSTSESVTLENQGVWYFRVRSSDTA